MAEVEVTFVPQEVINEQYVEAEDVDRVTFKVPEEDAKDSDGNFLEDDTHRSDHLRGHEEAPEKLKNENHPEYHDGPFYIQIGEIE